MTKLELISEARNHVSEIAKNTKIEKHDHVTTCYIGDSGSFVVTKQHQRWSTRKPEITFPNNCTKKEVLQLLNQMEIDEEYYESIMLPVNDPNNF